MHNALVEAAAENDEGLMERFFDSGTLSEEDLASGLRIAIANQQIFPVFCTSALYNMGSGRVMGFINDICPSPADTPPALLADGSTLPCDASGKTSVFIYKTITEPRVGLVSYFKVYSGVLHAGDELVNAYNQSVERFGQLFVVNGKQRDAEQQLSAGDIGATVKLKNSHTNNTLNTNYQKIVAKVPQMELYQYSSTLRSLSQGRAKFTRKFAAYQPATPEIQQQLIAAHRED